MQLGLERCSARIIGDNCKLRGACEQALQAEGVTLIDAAGQGGCADIVIALLSDMPRIKVSDLDDEALPLMSAWQEISALSRDVQAALPHMVKHGFGRVVFIGPIAGKTLDENGTVERVAALGMLGLQKNLAGEFGENGITANSILYDRRSGPENLLAENVAAACAYLASRPAAYLTGVVMTVDAGRQPSVF